MIEAADPRDFDCPPQVDPAAVERDLQMVLEAIALVGTGAASRVVVANIQFGRLILDAARRMALTNGVRVQPIWRLDMEADLAVERLHR